MKEQLLRHCLTALFFLILLRSTNAEPWVRHTIDNSSQGADGVRLADVNGDRRLDITTAWEEGGLVRVYLNPGPQKAKLRWPSVTVGHVSSPEDAVFADIDGDGAMDVVSSCEGKNRTIYVHWAPTKAANYLTPESWRTEAIPIFQGRQAWMFALPMEINGSDEIDFIVGSKGQNASVLWLETPAKARDLAQWKFHPLYQAGWIMSLVAHDMDRDGDLDVVISDRKGPRQGVLWLENPGADSRLLRKPWQEHRLGGSHQEVLFLTVEDIDQDGLADVLTSTRNGKMVLWRRSSKRPESWQLQSISNPYGLRNGKAVKVADINLDGRLDIVHSANTGGDRSKPGVCWLNYRQNISETHWQPHDISGPRGIKFDRLELLDLDEDGDLDVITCEERDNLGVFWYENPTRNATNESH